MLNCDKVPLRDKGCHIGVGAFMGATLPMIMPIWAAFIVSLAIATSKELHDRKTTGFSIDDILATTTGTIMGISIYAML